MPELRHWVGSLEGGGGPQGVPQTPRTLMPGGGGGGSARLQALVGAAGSRPLDPLMQQLMEGKPVTGIRGGKPVMQQLLEGKPAIGIPGVSQA